MHPLAPPSQSDDAPLGWRQQLTTAAASTTLALLLGACTFGSPGSLETPEGVAQILNSTPFKAPTSQQRWTTYTDARFNVQHGVTCTAADRAATKTTLGVRVSEQAAIPSNFQATVFLNGWETEYRSKDHHVTGLGTTIFNVTRFGNTLFWDAGGLISDKKGDDKFAWCYRYTLMMWKPSGGLGPWGDTTAFNRIEVTPHVSQAGQRLITVNDPELAQGKIMGVPALFDVATPGRPPRGKLLMGFALSYQHDDHHVLQLGFDYGQSVIDGPTIGWVSKALLQDKKADDGTTAAVISTVLTGESVHEWHPATVQRVEGSHGTGPIANQVTLAERSGSRVCASIGDNTDHVQTYSIPNVPYRYAVPMLTGWNLGYLCNDHHVQRAAAYIDDFRYERAPNAATGTLTYTVKSAFHDDGHRDVNLSSVAVTVLGINPTAPLGNGGGVGGAGGVAGN